VGGCARDGFKNDLNLIAVKNQLEEKAVKEQFALQLRDRDGEIARLRDMKARLSTKMVGETLEQHCEIEFNRIRAAAFQRAHFEKDNDARTGSKGDYIFRDSDESGAEIVSIMFEMKNESDETATSLKPSWTNSRRRLAAIGAWPLRVLKKLFGALTKR
jgi:hypothetical protein